MIKRIPSIYNHILIIALPFWALYSHTFMKLIDDWSNDDNYSHGFLIPFITGYMIWQKKDDLKEIVLKPDNLGILVVLAGVMMHIVGNVGAELFVMRASIIVTLWGLILYLFGRKVGWLIIIPIVYLIFMIPLPSIIWNQIAFPLQLFAAKLSSQVIQMFGMPILREGNILHLSNTTLEVVDACSGLRSLNSLMALGGAFAYISLMYRWTQWALFLSAIPIAIAVNIIRLTITAFMARYIGPEAAHGFLHDMSGLLVFAVAFILLYLVYWVLDRFESKAYDS